MPRPRCGNDPRAQLTPADRQAITDFRAYLAHRRHQEKTMTDLDNARAALEQHLDTPQARTALEAFEAAVRANERGTTPAAIGLPFRYVDHDGDQLHIGVLNSSRHHLDVVYICAEEGGEQATVHIRPESVDTAVAALRAAEAELNRRTRTQQTTTAHP